MDHHHRELNIQPTEPGETYKGPETCECHLPRTLWALTHAMQRRWATGSVLQLYTVWRATAFFSFQFSETVHGTHCVLMLLNTLGIPEWLWLGMCGL